MAPPLEEEDTTTAEAVSNYYELHSIDATIVIRQLPSKGISFQLWPAATTFLNLLDRTSSLSLSHSTNPTSLSSSLFPITTRGRPIRVLELGSGTGLVGIAAAALLGANVTVTDLPHVLPNLQFNVAANAGILELHGGAVDVAALRWGDTKDMEAIGRDYDVIVGSDVVYHDHLFEPLLQTLKFFLLGSEKKIVFLMGHLKRWKKESSFFKKAYRFFDVEVLHTDCPSNGSRVGVTVYQFVRNSGKKLKSQSS